jgi:hypothetical protein
MAVKTTRYGDKRVVAVMWYDSKTIDGEVTAAEANTDMGMFSSGFIIGEDSNTLTIARDINPGNDPATYRGVMVIPKVNIGQLYELNNRQPEQGFEELMALWNCIPFTTKVKAAGMIDEFMREQSGSSMNCGQAQAVDTP